MHRKGLSFERRTCLTESLMPHMGLADSEISLAVLQFFPQYQGDGMTSLQNSGITHGLRFISIDNTPDAHTLSEPRYSMVFITDHHFPAA